MTTDLQRVMAEGAVKVVGGRPPGCPHRYCGCGASICIFGKIIPSLNLAAGCDFHERPRRSAWSRLAGAMCSCSGSR